MSHFKPFLAYSTSVGSGKTFAVSEESELSDDMGFIEN